MPVSRRQPNPRETARRRPVQARSRACVDAILEASAHILRDGGLAALNTNRIAERAGVSIGTLYGYFADKNAIIDALARAILDDDEAAVRAALSEASDPATALVHALVRRHRTDRRYRATVLTRHTAMGFGAEHARRAEAGIAAVVATLCPDPSTRPDATRIFVASRAILGVCRALTDDAAPAGIAEVERELVAALRGWLSLNSPPRSPAAAPPATPSPPAPS